MRDVAARSADAHKSRWPLEDMLGADLVGTAARRIAAACGVRVEEANITVPESLGGGAQLIDVEHRQAPANVQRTLDRARIDERTGLVAAMLVNNEIGVVQPLA